MEIDTKILLRIAADLQKEVIRTDDLLVKENLNKQIEALKVFKKEVDDFRTIKKMLTEQPNQ